MADVCRNGMAFLLCSPLPLSSQTLPNSALSVSPAFLELPHEWWLGGRGMQLAKVYLRAEEGRPLSPFPFFLRKENREREREED